MNIKRRIEKLEQVKNTQDSGIILYLVGEDGTRIKAQPDSPKDQAIYNQWVTEAKTRADEITRQDLIKRGIIQAGDNWTPDGRG